MYTHIYIYTENRINVVQHFFCTTFLDVLYNKAILWLATTTMSVLLCDYIRTYTVAMNEWPASQRLLFELPIFCQWGFLIQLEHSRAGLYDFYSQNVTWTRGKKSITRDVKGWKYIITTWYMKAVHRTCTNVNKLKPNSLPSKVTCEKTGMDLDVLFNGLDHS